MAEANRGELIEKVIKIQRCAAVVKGGRRFSFAAMVVVGNGRGKVGWGYGKANEVPPSVEKAVEGRLAQHGRTCRWTAARFRTRSKAAYGAAHVVLVPASPGTGVIAGSARAGRVRSGRHPRHPDQELRLEQSDQPRQGRDGRARHSCARGTKSSGCEE